MSNYEKISALSELDDIIDEIEHLENKIKQLKDEEIKKTLDKVLEQCENEEIKLKTINFIYWTKEEVKASDLSNALGLKHPNQLKYHLNNTQGNIICSVCNEKMKFSSRSELKMKMQNIRNVRFRRETNFMCRDCIDERVADFSKECDLKEQARKVRVQELRNMPYKEYLLTPEWKSKRLEVLKDASYRCQLCNTNKESLHVHHRTYERRGDEWFGDLTVLCSGCHKSFHEHSVLKGS